MEVRRPGRPRHGSRFAPTHERVLVDSALWSARNLPNAVRGLTVVEEMAGPFGVPDFVAIVGPVENIAGRWKLEVPPLLNDIDAGIAAALNPSVARSVAWIAGRLQWPESSVRRRLPGL